ncbi:uncharacterized protein LOC143917366 isoform X2 [Arctopsyche grandis]|uniref:uncharacterized protein LOC143917366 isoform X2 n=1 Tax=Arctopsyche grandis TaxID=121162 RepID=UPI00406D90E3
MTRSLFSSKFNRDFDTQFASPPAHDDSFFLIRYPNAGSLLGATNKQQSGIAAQVQQTVSAPKKEITDWSKHTQPCQQFISGVPFGTLSKCPPTVKPKPAGTDDGFKGEGAACGSSIVRVAQQMISSRSNSRGTSLEPVSEHGLIQMANDPEAVVSAVDKNSLAPGSTYNNNMRRGSKSLPATPLNSPPGSPGSKRKNRNTINRFFTSPFELPSDVNGSRSWILAGLLGQQREAINEEGQNSLVASAENLVSSSNVDASKISQQVSANQETFAPKPQVYRPKPSELREMNFLSPTSM